MKKGQDCSKFNGSLTKFINKQWSRVKHSSGSLKSTKNLDQLLEEEYEILLKEIDYLASEKSCYLSFKNDKFPFRKSSEDLTKTLKKHSKEVLRNYITRNDKDAENVKLHTREDLINYVTEIVISRPKCNNKICTCKPLKISKEVLTDATYFKENGKETQTLVDNRKSGRRQVGQASTQIQSDDWVPELNCPCHCPNLGSQVTIKGVSTIENVNASTSHSKKIAFKDTYVNCSVDVAEIQTSTNKLCVPAHFEALLKTTNKFTACVSTKDCQCEAYDINEAIKRGLVLPSKEICIQNKQTSSQKVEESTSSVDVSEDLTKTSSGSQINNKTKKEAKKLKENKEKKKDKVQQKKVKKEKSETTGCFGSKKKTKGCDDDCQGIVGRQQSMQTIPINVQDKSEEAHTSGHNGNKSASTSTDSEVATQMSESSSNEILKKKSKHDKQTSPKEKDTREQSSQKFPAEGTTCNKCGRQKKDCVSGCRNTIIIPQASGSTKTIYPGEAESLRMLIKMHCKDTNRQFDNLMTELSNQKGEISRLNDMYQKMMFSLNDMTKSTGNSGSYNTRKTFEASPETSSFNRKRDKSRPCGCNFDNQCKIGKQISSIEKYPNTYDDCLCDKKSITIAPVRKFGPPNTAVAINRCETCHVEISANSHFSREYDFFNENKLRKDELNRSRRAKHASRNIVVRNEGKRDVDDHSITTIFEKDKLHKESSIGEGSKRENLLNGKTTELKNLQQENADERPNILPSFEEKDHIDIESESGKKSASSRVLIWLKQSWMSIKYKTEQCRQKDKEKREKSKAMDHLFNFCRTAKRAVGVLGILKSATKAAC